MLLALIYKGFSINTIRLTYNYLTRFVLKVIKLMKKEKIDCEKARNISIIEILEKLSFFPIKKSEKEAWFLSPFRSETQASFKVDLRINRWYDHGSGKGGNVLDFIMLFNNYSVTEALSFLNDDITIFSFQQYQKKPDITFLTYEVVKVKSLEHIALISYLLKRGISIEIAKIYCVEIHYKLKGKYFFAIGFESKKGSYELRNKYFKGCINSKSISNLKTGNKKVCVFEGFMDFLSYKTLHNSQSLKEDYIICNSTALVRKLIYELKNYSAIHLFFDNDFAGNESTEFLMKNLDGVIDCRNIFSDFKDINEYLINGINQRKISGYNG